jgi:pre-mRNA-splicing factor 18
MDKLKELLASKRKAAEEEFAGKKYAKRSEIEDIRIRKLKEEEERERQEKEQKQRERQHTEATARDDGGHHHQSRRSEGRTLSSEPNRVPTPLPEIQLPKQEVIRRLRVLRQPATVFGETDAQRALRLADAEKNVRMEDETAGGQQANVRLEIEREERDRARYGTTREDRSGGGGGRERSPAVGAAAAPSRARQSRGEGLPGSSSIDETAFGAGGGGGGGGAQDAQGTSASTGREALAMTATTDETDAEERRLMASFQAAAEAVAEKSMPVEDRVAKWLRRWMEEWERELALRNETERNVPSGRQMEMRFKETQQYLRPLFSRLRSRALDPQLLAGIKLMVDFMKERNYLQAYKIYMGVAIGNSPWPIGVTHVGLHERSAREKISFKYSTGSAHIMNDEATRKFIQALKRLMTFVQRRYPTDPSRSVDFDGSVDAGANKAALLQAVARGDDVAPAPAPAHLDERGRVKVPESWDRTIKNALKEVTGEEDG